VRAFFLGLGLIEIAATTLRRATGDVGVCFLTSGSTTLELYAPPVPPDPSPEPYWRRLLVTGLVRPVRGPEGLLLVLGDGPAP
jgi:hypothetical protein